MPRNLCSPLSTGIPSSLHDAVRPPTTGPASSTRTRRPAAAPASPDPTTTTPNGLMGPPRDGDRTRRPPRPVAVTGGSHEPVRWRGGRVRAGGGGRRPPGPGAGGRAGRRRADGVVERGRDARRERAAQVPRHLPRPAAAAAG